MPQGRRKVPFSGKRKKEQLIAKREQKASRKYNDAEDHDDDDDEQNSHASSSRIKKIEKINVQREVKSSRYALQFFRELDEDIKLGKRKAYEPFCPVEPEERQMGATYFNSYDFPIRPAWNYNMSKEELERNENRYFTEYIREIEKRHNEENKALSVFELNLETWRQLWRVLEISDILLLIVDVRYSALMFPPALFQYITVVLQKNVILVLNKVDLVKPEVAVAWKDYFSETYPGISVVYFASYKAQEPSNLKTKNRRKPSKMNSECTLEIFKHVKRIVGSDLDLSSWEDKIMADITAEKLTVDYTLESDAKNAEIPTHIESTEFDFNEHVKYKNGIVTIGCIGFPNVGKSSVINALKGRKVVSVSRTPGHTKYFQTIFLTNNVKLSDCPGIVFPSSTPKHLQVILGSYPIAQLREPYQSIRYIAERIDLTKLLSIELAPDETKWSAMAICEAWALKRQFLTSKAARPDTYRAANNLLRLAIQGRIVVNFFPPKYFENNEKWQNHVDINWVQSMQTAIPVLDEIEEHYSSHSESEDGENADQDQSSSDEELTAMPTSKNAFSLLEDD